jgi:hypothetical protein
LQLDVAVQAESGRGRRDLQCVLTVFYQNVY